MFKFNVFSLLKTLPEKILTSTGAAPDKPIPDGIEHITILNGSVDINPEYWIGRFSDTTSDKETHK